MKAVTWRGVNEIGVEDVPEPTILNGHDIILEVGLSATCGSDLHLLGGHIPAMRAGDVVMSLDDGPKGYRMFKDRENGCVRAVFRPGT